MPKIPSIVFCFKGLKQTDKRINRASYPLNMDRPRDLIMNPIWLCLDRGQVWAFFIYLHGPVYGK